MPVLLRPSIAGMQPEITRLASAISTLRGSAEGARQAIAGWHSDSVHELNMAKRHVLAALDGLDAEITDTLHLTRELERTVEEFLGG